MKMEEIWKDVPGYEGHYQVSNLGRCKSLDRVNIKSNGVPNRLKERILKTSNSSSYIKYHKVSLSDPVTKKQKFYLVHALVLTTFLGPRPMGMQSCHNNGIPSDNRLENLRWGTSKENHADRKNHGTEQAKGEKSVNSILTEKDVLEIRGTYKKYNRIFSCKSISEKYGVSSETIRAVVNRVTWKHLS